MTRRRVFLAATLFVGVGCYEVSPSSRTEAPPPAADEPQTKARSARALLDARGTTTNRTYQDLLESELDDALFAHYFTSERMVILPPRSPRLPGPRVDPTQPHETSRWLEAHVKSLAAAP